MTDEARQKKIAVRYMTAIGVTEEGQLSVTKTYADRIETMTFDDVTEIELLLEELTDKLPQETCPKCGRLMQTWYVREYTCEACSQTYSEGGLDAWREIEKTRQQED